MKNNQILDLADRLKAAKDLKKDLEARAEAVGTEIQQLDKELSMAMAEEELDKFTRNGYTFYLTSRLYASPTSGQREALFTALRKNGYGSLVTETVNANTLASFCKEQRAANSDELPDWLKAVVTTFDKVTVGVRKG